MLHIINKPIKIAVSWAITVVITTNLFILPGGFPGLRYQANHLGLCPPDLCNASTDVASRAGQYMQLFGRRSKETLQVGKTGGSWRIPPGILEYDGDSVGI